MKYIKAFLGSFVGFIISIIVASKIMVAGSNLHILICILYLIGIVIFYAEDIKEQLKNRDNI